MSCGRTEPPHWPGTRWSTPARNGGGSRLRRAGDLENVSLYSPSNGLVSITDAVVSLFNGWAITHIDIYRDYRPEPGEGTKIATFTIGTSAPVSIWAPTGGGGSGSSTLSGLSDVTISSLSAGQALVYRNGAWRNEAITPGTGLYLGDLENVSLYSPSNGQALIYRNGAWVNETIQGGGGGGYVGYTATTASAGPLNLYGIPYINATNVASSPSRIVWNAELGAWHFYGNLYADGWVSAGGAGGGGGGGGGVTSLYALDEVLSSTSPSTNQVFYFNGSKWTATTLKTVGGTSLIGSGNIPVSGGGGSSVSWGTVGADHVYLSVDNVSRKLLTAHQSLTNYVTLDTAQTITGTKTFTGGVVVDSSSYIDLGDARLVWDSTNHAVHITKRPGSSYTGYIGVYADGFVSSGDAGQSS